MRIFVNNLKIKLSVAKGNELILKVIIKYKTVLMIVKSCILPDRFSLY